jgi:alpha-1,3-glucosyltransferase
MEITHHLPISEWYWYDLNYWGLDYPPLTAYVSWMFGWMAHAAGSLDGLRVLKDLVALDSSRGFEESGGKMFMRFTVLIMDLLVYFSAVWALIPRLVTNNDGEKQRICLLILAWAQPAIILIDHGHFQYNTVSLGLALWSFHFITMRSNPFGSIKEGGDSFIGPITGSVMFSLALNFKQMELYHAPALFAYLLGRCFSDRKHNGSVDTRRAVTKFCLLGMTVISTFTLLWFPFVIYPRSSDVTKFHSAGIAQVIQRLFPFQRGLFEGKVSNIWCALSVKPFSIRKRVPESSLPFLALGLTLMLILPPCWFLFEAGRCQTITDKATTKKNGRKSPLRNVSGAKDLKFVLWGSAATALAFFLASFQVHEKGILIPLAPISLLILDAPRFISWFSVVAAWTLWPLIVIDRLANPYVCCIVIFICVCNLSSITSCENHLDIFWENPTKFILPLSGAIMVLSHISELFIVPPRNLPDLFPVLWSIFGCGMCIFSYLVTIWAMTMMNNERNTTGAQKGTTKGKRQNTGIFLVGISLLGIAILPTTDGFLLPQKPRILCNKLLFSKVNEVFSPEMLERARVPLYWERQRVEDAKPVLDLSKRDPGTLSLSEEAIVNKDGIHNLSIAADYDEEENEWENGSVWLETKQHLISLGVLLNETASGLPKQNLLTPKTMIDRAPQLIRLPTAQVIESANFFIDEQCTLISLIQLDPAILTYTADNLCYGMEYLSNMMARGDRTKAIQMIQTQLSLSPQMALGLFRMGIDGGIDEKRVSNALENATAAAGKAVEFAVGDAGRTYREFKRLKAGKNTLS